MYAHIKLRLSEVVTLSGIPCSHLSEILLPFEPEMKDIANGVDNLADVKHASDELILAGTNVQYCPRALNRCAIEK